MVLSDKQRFGEILVRAGVLERAVLEQVLNDLGDDAGDLGEALVRRKLIDESAMLQAVSKALNLPAVGLDHAQPDERALALVPRELCVAHHLIPLEVERSRTGEHLHVAMANPADVVAIKQVTRKARRRIRPLVASARSIRAAIDRFYGAAQPASPPASPSPPSMHNPAGSTSATGPRRAQPARPKSIELELDRPARRPSESRARAPRSASDYPFTVEPLRPAGAPSKSGSGSSKPLPTPEPEYALDLGFDGFDSPRHQPEPVEPRSPIDRRESLPERPSAMEAGQRRSGSLRRTSDDDLLEVLDSTDMGVLGSDRGAPPTRGSDFGIMRRKRRPRARSEVSDTITPVSSNQPVARGAGGAKPGPLPPLPPGLRSRRRRPERNTTNRPEPRRRPGTSPPPGKMPTSRHAGELHDDPAVTPRGLVDDRLTEERVDVRRLLERYVSDNDEDTTGADEVLEAYLERYGQSPGRGRGTQAFAAVERALDGARGSSARLLVVLIRHLARRGLVDLDELLAAIRE